MLDSDKAIACINDPVAEVDEAELGVAGASDEARAEELERRFKAEAEEQFKRAKSDAQAIYGLTRGRPGVSSPEAWAALIEKAGDEIGNGRFIVRQLGADRYLDPEIVAVLLAFRQNLIAENEVNTAADIMRIDIAVIGYYNMLRTQGWIGNLCLVVERELFGQAPLNSFHGSVVGAQLEEQLRRLAEVIMPLQERAARMTLKGLEALCATRARPARKRRSSSRPVASRAPRP